MNPINSVLNSILENNYFLTINGLAGSATSLILGRVMQADRQPLVIVTATDERAEELAAELSCFSGLSVLYFPAEPHLPYAEVAYDFEASIDRMAIQVDLLGEKPWYAITMSLNAFIRKTISPFELESRGNLLLKGEEIERQDIISHLVSCGYEQVTTVDEAGTFALRGAIIDFYRPNDRYPVRIDLFGDLIDGLYSFDPQTQRRIGNLEDITIYPIREIILDGKSTPRLLAGLDELSKLFTISDKKMASFRADITENINFFGIESFSPLLYEKPATIWDYLQKSRPLLIFEERGQLADAVQKLAELAAHEYEAAKERQSPHLPPAAHFLTPGELTNLWESITPRLDLQQFAAGGQCDTGIYEPLTSLRQDLAARRINPSLGEVLDPLEKSLKDWRARAYRIILACSTEARAKRLQLLMKGRKFPLDISLLPIAKAIEQIPRAGGTLICVANVGEAFRCDNIIIIPDTIIFGLPPAATGRRTQNKVQKNSGGGLEATDLRNLKEGDLIIHSEHGIGQYRGIERLTIDGMVGDYVWLEYDGGDRLYLPMVHLGLIHPYRGPTGVKLDKLGSTRWEKARQKVRNATQELATKLLAIQAKRQTRESHSFDGSAEAYAAFEARFPYEETPDQQKAIEAVLRDLRSPHPMDRLVCGDVGFGKTEVAIRAAFRVVLDGYQVAVLVPTTILAMQHARTFSDRLRDEPVRIEVLSRFKSAKEVRQILADTQAGKVDILIGTHRLLSGDINFNKLGLLIIDEEQRFGVRHKEKLRELKAEIDTLTLTATPIPRTMYMSMVGLRDISLIRTPPVERHAVKTIVSRYDSAILTEAIDKELARGGQVYILYNDVATIEKMATEVRMLVPAARVAIAHGQMEGNGLEQVMADFINRISNVLVCSTIIENGLDIPSVNTIIVIRADLFGLAQLYQIRGRVGRGRQKAFAYMFLPENGSVTMEARQRLAALQRFSALGDGVSIAQEDLELRGSGDLLGPDQSGNIAAVGFELYTELLAEAVEQIKNGHADNYLDNVEVKLPITAHIPDDYIPNIGQRINYYQQLSKISDTQELQQFVNQISDMFGPLPEPFENLLAIFGFQPLLRQLGASALQGQERENHTFISLQLTGHGLLTAEKLGQLCTSYPREYRLTPSGRLVMIFDGLAESAVEWLNITREMLQGLMKRIS